jgi:hypothetical protein
MIPLIIVLCVLAVGILFGARLAPYIRAEARNSPMYRRTRFFLPALVIGVVALMLSPTLWAAIPILQGTESDLPLAGPAQQGGPGIVQEGSKRGSGAGTFMPGGNATVDPALIRYLEEHQGHAQILVATNGMADGLILATNRPVMPLGGFSSYPLTTTELASLVAKGRLRFILLSQMQIPSQLLDQSSGQGQSIQIVGGGPGNDQRSAITTWVTQHCKAVPPSLWQSSSTSSGTGTGSGSNGAQLYDCAMAH